MEKEKDCWEDVTIEEVIDHFGVDNILESMDAYDVMGSVDIDDFISYHGKDKILCHFDYDDFLDRITDNNRTEHEVVREKILDICRMESPYRYLTKTDIKEILNDMVDFYFNV